MGSRIFLKKQGRWNNFYGLWNRAVEWGVLFRQFYSNNRALILIDIQYSFNVRLASIRALNTSYSIYKKGLDFRSLVQNIVIILIHSYKYPSQDIIWGKWKFKIIFIKHLKFSSSYLKDYIISWRKKVFKISVLSIKCLSINDSN